MGQVILSLEEYDQLKKQADLVTQTKECFELRKRYDGEITLGISLGKTKEIFKKIFESSRYASDFEMQTREDINYNYVDEVSGYYIKAVKKSVVEEVESNNSEGDEE